MSEQAGRALDAEVAEKVMSQEVMTHGTPGSERLSLYHAGDLSALPPYSTKIDSAWEVVAKMEEEGRWLGLSRHRDGWRAVFSSTRGAAPLHPSADADTVALSICLAALAALRATD